MLAGLIGRAGGCVIGASTELLWLCDNMIEPPDS